MTGMWNRFFGGGADKLFETAEALGRDECWPEAISTVEKALGRLPENDREGRARGEKLLAELTSNYKEHLVDAIATLEGDGDLDDARELLDIALSFAADDAEKARFETLLWRPNGLARTPAIAAGEAAATTPGSETASDIRAKRASVDHRDDDLITALTDSYTEPLEEAEKEAIFARPVKFRRGFVLWSEGRFEDAAELLGEFIENAPHDPYGLLFLGLARAGSGAKEEGVKLLGEAIRSEPSLVLATLSRGIILKDLDRPREAADMLGKLCDIVLQYPDRFGPRRRADVLVHTIDALLSADDAAEAEKLYRKVRGEKLLDGDLSLEARIAEGLGDHDTAAAVWEVFLDPQGVGGTIVGHGTARRGPEPADFERAADFFGRIGEWKKAATFYEKGALALTRAAQTTSEPIPLDELLRMRKKLAFALIAMGKEEDAERIAEEMERIDPVPAEAVEIRAKLGG